MSKRKSKAITVGRSETSCPQCNGNMIIRGHKEITQKLKSQYYYFTQWDYCTACRKVFFDERFRVINSKGADLEEIERQKSFLKSI